VSQPSHKAPRVLLADDHAILLQGLRVLLKEANVEVVGEASDGYEAIRLSEKLAPDIAVLDICMPLLNGIDAAREIRKTSPKTKILLLTMHAEHQYVLAGLRVGVAGYVLKNNAVSSLLQAIDAASKGEFYLSPGEQRSPRRSDEHSGTRGPAIDRRRKKCKGDWSHFGDQHEDG